MAFYDTPRGKAAISILGAALVGFVAYTGEGIQLLGIPGIESRSTRVEAVRDTISVLQAQTDSAKQELATGSIDDIKQRVEEYQGTLTVLREFVPDGNEVPNLLDDIATRAKVRGVTLSQFVPQPVQSGPYPFDTFSYNVSVIGRYDEIGAFLADVASLRRIVVPNNVLLKAAEANEARALGDSSTAMLEATFQVKTYVKGLLGGNESGS